MRTEYLVAIAVTAAAGMVGSTVYSVTTSDNCPKPSAASVTTLFAPCQAFAAATGPGITIEEVMDVGPLPPSPGPTSAPARAPTPTPAQLAEEHATVGVATSKRQH